MKTKRKDFPAEVEDQIFFKSRRLCALCVYLERDLRWKKGQIAHIDRNATNVDPDNGAYLCTAHHDDYDSKPSQTKRFTPAELKAYRDDLYKMTASPEWLYLSSRSTPSRKSSRSSPKHGVTLDVYDRRIPVYRMTIQFLRDVTKDLKPDFQLILTFARSTEEALFLFDDNITQYLDEMFKNALHLHTVNVQLEGINRIGRGAENFNALLEEHTKLAMWFTGQYDVIRRHFAPFLRLA